MSEWEEIKRLAADFQRTQASDTLQRLSERNCIDLVKMLTDQKLIDLIYSRDGKEFITPSHLRKEIEDEVYANGGRMAINDLANVLNVDFNHVEFLAKELTSELPEYQLILGQIIHNSYKSTVGKQIQDTLLISGQISIAEVSKSLDLPSEFLSTIVKELLTATKVVSLDDNTYYTIETMDRYRSIIAGTLSAIMKPTSIASIMKRLGIPEKIFAPIVDGLIKDGRVDASIENRIYIPAIYSREQNEWIEKFYRSNSYIGYDVLTRMDVKQPKAYLRKRFPDGFALKSCYVSPDLISQVESLVEDAIVSNGWIDISSIVPPSIEAEDIEMLVQVIFKRNEQFPSSCLVLNQVNVISHGFIATCKLSFKDTMKRKAEEQLRNGNLVNYFLGGELKKKRQVSGEQEGQVQQESAKSGNDESKLTSSQRPDELEQSNEPIESQEQQNQENEPQPSGKGSKRDKKEKKEKNVMVPDDSDEDQGGKKSRSRKSGGGTQGREIKQKATKKKYLPGNKGKQAANNDSSDDEPAPTKTPRSVKGRAARRGISPLERINPASQSSVNKSKGGISGPRGQDSGVQKKEPLVFMATEEIANKLRYQSQDSNDGSDELFESIADLIEDELNASYGVLAKETLDEYLQSLADESDGVEQAKQSAIGADSAME